MAKTCVSCVSASVLFEINRLLPGVVASVASACVRLRPPPACFASRSAGREAALVFIPPDATVQARSSPIAWAGTALRVGAIRPCRRAINCTAGRPDSGRQVPSSAHARKAAPAIWTARCERHDRQTVMNDTLARSRRKSPVACRVGCRLQPPGGSGMTGERSCMPR